MQFSLYLDETFNRALNKKISKSVKNKAKSDGSKDRFLLLYPNYGTHYRAKSEIRLRLSFFLKINKSIWASA